MSWWHQVWHVFRRDVARTWKVLLAFACLLAITTGKVLEWRPLMGDATSLANAFVVLCALVAIVLAVQSDDTTRPDAFWAIQPLRATAVAASKVLYAWMLAAAFALVAMLVVHAWQLELISGPGRPGVGLFPVLPLALLGFALLASSCRGFLLVALTCVASVIALFVLAPQVGSSRLEVSAVAWWVAMHVVLLAAMLLLLWRYRSASLALAPRVATGVSGLAVVVVPAFVNRAAPVAPVSHAGTGRGIEAVSLGIPTGSQVVMCQGGTLFVYMRLQTPIGWRVKLSHPQLRVTLLDGTTEVLTPIAGREVSSFELSSFEVPIVPVVDDRPAWSVLGAAEETDEIPTQVSLPLPDGGRTRICGKVARIALRVQAEAWTGVEVMRIPLEPGARAESPGLRMMVLAADSIDGAPDITVRISRLAGSPADKRGAAGAVDFALLNPARGELLRLHTGSSSYFGLGGLPGLDHNVATLHLSPYRRGIPAMDSLSARWAEPLALLAIAPEARATGWKDVEAVVMK